MRVISRLLLVWVLVAASARAQDGGVARVLTPFPSDAQCLSLGSIRQPLAFGPGETLEFDLDALGARAGTMTMRVLPPREGLLPIEVHAKTNTFFSKVRRVDGTGTSYLWPKTLRPQRYYEDAQENEWHRVADVTFRKNKTAKLVSSINGQTSQAELSYGNDVTDVAGAVFLMRQLELSEGKRLCFDVYGIRRIWRVWGTVQPKEHVSLPVGEFETWHLSGEAARHDWQDARRDIHVWITADERRLPIAALGSIDLGAVRATLTSFTRPGDKAAKAENKGNLKW
ncbi:MAG: DUF3108 domain-containing protein [Myxococcaceae bacterium]|nr:DUF3108 domain-containing protein [Myxococcaceae bacterium]